MFEDHTLVITVIECAVFTILIASEIWSHIDAVTVVERVLKLDTLDRGSKDSKDKLRIHMKVLFE